MKKTIPFIQRLKDKEKVVAITSYDALFASIFDESVDIILVGDSLSMSFGGNEDTLPLDINAMIYHTKAVRRGVESALLVADMPFGSYNTIDEGLKNATRLYKECGADAVKLEVNESKIPLVRELTNNGIAVMAHIGLMPQYYRFEGGYKIKGKSDSERENLLYLASEFQNAGAFSLIIEGVKSDIATQITRKVQIPTIGIGSGSGTDGQILVWSDAFGFYDKLAPKFVRRYLNGKELLQNAINQYAQDVKNGNFPNESESY